MSYYLSILAVYLVVYALGSWALNLQFGLGGIVNFAFIIFESAGAYAAALCTLGPSGQFGQSYFWGTHLPFPVPLLVGTAVGGLLALLIGPVTMRKMRRDYQAATMLVIAIIASQVVTNARSFLGGAAGVSGVPQPFSDYFNRSGAEWLYVAWATALAVLCYWIVRRIGFSPFGRSLRALRDDETAASALGKDAWSIRMSVFVVGGMIGGLAGALLVEFIGAWSPAAWGYQETFVLLVAVILGGIGNQLGSLVGAFIVGVVLTQVPSLLPQFGYPGLVSSLDWILTGLVWLGVLWFLPGGIVPEPTALKLSGKEGAGRRLLGRRETANGMMAAGASYREAAPIMEQTGRGEDD